MKQDTEPHPLSSLELCQFSGNAVQWTEFIKSFCNKIQLKVTFNDNICIATLKSVLKGDTKRSVQSTGTSGICYTTVPKTLKRVFGHNLLILHFKLILT